MKRLAGIAAILIIAGSANADLILNTTGDVITQNFDTLATSGTSNPWTDNSTINGWFAARQPSPGTALISYQAGTGSGNAGALWSWGTSTERALGSLGSGAAYWGSPSTGSLAGYYGVKIVNSTGLTLTQFTATYDLEQWRDGGSATPTQQSHVVEWAVDPANWFDAFNAGTSTLGPVAANTGSGTALDGNAAANRIAGVSFAPTVTWNNGSSLWIRFRELNDTGNDHGLSVDNFQLTVVPEPATVGLLAGPGLGILVACMRRREDEAGA